MSRYISDRIEFPVAMVAEDDDRARIEVANYLRALGYGVLEARTSVEALLLAVDYPHRIDAVFTSLELRKYCNGAELAGCLRVMRPDMAIFYMGAEGVKNEAVTQELIQGEAVYLSKPVTAPRIDDAASMVTERRAEIDSLELSFTNWTDPNS